MGLADEPDPIVVAPGNHQVLLENDRVRVIHTTVAIGATTPVHTHRWRSAEYVLSATDFVRRDGEGTVVFDTRAARGVAPVGSFVGATVPRHSVEKGVGVRRLEAATGGHGRLPGRVVDTPLPNPCRPCCAGAEPFATLHRRGRDPTQPGSKTKPTFDVPTGGVVLLTFTVALNPTLVGSTTAMLLLPRPERLMLRCWLGAILTLGLVIGVCLVLI